jgi:hypothetical protein
MHNAIRANPDMLLQKILIKKQTGWSEARSVFLLLFHHQFIDGNFRAACNALAFVFHNGVSIAHLIDDVALWANPDANNAAPGDCLCSYSIHC